MSDCKHCKAEDVETHLLNGKQVCEDCASKVIECRFADGHLWGCDNCNEWADDVYSIENGGKGSFCEDCMTNNHWWGA